MYAKRIKELRLKRQLTQLEVAAELGIAGPSYAAYESGKTSPSINTLIKIAQMYGVTLDWICGIEKPKDDPTLYSDVIERLVAIDHAIPLKIVASQAINPNPESDDVENAYWTAVVFEDHFMNRFLKELKKMLDLSRSGTIDDDLFRLWVARQIHEHVEETNHVAEIRARYEAWKKENPDAPYAAYLYFLGGLDNA